MYNQVLIAQHASDLTKGQNKKFAHLLQNLSTTYSMPPQLTEGLNPKIPTTFADIRQKCTEGPNSVVMNLPYPDIQTDVPGHCYIKISHVLEDFLAHGFLPLQPSLTHSEDWITNIAQSPQLVSSLQEAIAKYGQEPFYFIAFKEWQDDYESQYARKDRGSVWCKNITILAEPGTPRHICTYPIAFSSKQTHHHKVEDMIEKDMQQFAGDTPKLFYSSKLGKQIPVHACLYISLADQLERRPVTCTTNGNHNFHARFGYSIKFKSLLTRLPSCPTCRDIMAEKMATIYNDCHISRPREDCQIPTCDTCLSWLHDLDRYDNLSYAPPENYPLSELNQDGTIRPFKLTFQKLITAGNTATDHILEGSWTIQEADAYLDVHCIASSTRDDIIQRASLQRQINTAVTGTPAHASLQERIQEMQGLDPTTLDPWIPPATWTRSVTLSQHLDAPMHLIFHGIIKGICQLLLNWLKSRRSQTSFGRYYTGILDPIADYSLDWCKLTYFSGSFAGWLAENYVGLSKISLWFWSGLLEVSQDPEYEEPTTPYRSWNGTICKEWLKSRGISTKEMMAPEAKAKVAELMNLPGGPPTVPPPTGGSVDIVLSMLYSLERMVRVLMSGAYPVGGKSVITLHIVDFLNSFDSFKPLNENRKFPEWLTMYNFLCLLNLPDAIEQLGPLRFNYEGSSEGEGFIPMVKPLLSQGMRKNWQKNLAHRFFRERAMKLVLRDAHVFIGTNNGDGTYMESSYKKKMFHKYKRWQQIQSLFDRGAPISAVVLRDGFLGAVIDNSDAWLLVPIQLHQFRGTNAGLHYFSVQLFEHNTTGVVTRNVINIGKVADIQHCVLFLPWLKAEKYVAGADNAWTMVGGEYERLGQDGTLQSVYHLPVHLQNQERYMQQVANMEEDVDDGSLTLNMEYEYDEQYLEDLDGVI